MDPITIGLVGISALGKLGGILGSKKRKQLNPEELKRLFGAKAITDEQLELFNRIINSPQGQQLMTSAAQQGQQFQTDVARRAAEVGLGPSGGAIGGADIFAGAASESAVGNLQRSMRGSLMEAMLPIAQQLVSDRMQAWLSDRERVMGQTTKFQDIMGAVTGLGSELLTARQADQAAGAKQDVSRVVAAKPAGAAPTEVLPAAAPAGATPVTGGTSNLAMAHPFVQQAMPGARQRQYRDILGGGGRFARAMSNRFGAVQPAGAY